MAGLLFVRRSSISPLRSGTCSRQGRFSRGISGRTGQSGVASCRPDPVWPALVDLVARRRDRRPARRAALAHAF